MLSACLVMFAAAAASAPVHAQEVIYESAEFVPSEEPLGPFIANGNNWQGVSFETTVARHITRIGAHIATEGIGDTTIFIAIFPLFSGLPPSPPNVADAVFVTTTMAPPDTAGDYRVETDLELPAGSWALIFGSGAAGAAGAVTFPADNHEIGSPAYVLNLAGEWVHRTTRNQRFFVESSPLACGDRIVSGDEACDDGNVSNRDDCLNSCEWAYCGDGFVKHDEACDDGNASNSDGCTNECTLRQVARSIGTQANGGGICHIQMSAPSPAPHPWLALVALTWLRRRRRCRAMD